MYRAGEAVTATTVILDERRLVALPGERGCVEYVAADGVPTVRWERTGRAVDCDDTEIAR